MSPPTSALLAPVVVLLLGAAGVPPDEVREDGEEEAAAESACAGPSVREVSHRVEGRVEGGRVRLTVHRTFHNASEHFLAWETGLSLPPGATVHGFALESQGTWTEGLLLEAAEAERRDEALRKEGRASPRPLARLSLSGQAPWLSLWSLPPRAPVTVRYELVLRPTWDRGESAFTYPLSWDKDTDPTPSLTLAPPFPGARVRIERTKADWGEERLAVSWRERPLVGLDARAGVAPWGPGSLGLLQLRTGQLSEAPQRARVVFVLDASHSVGAPGIAQQLALAERYLQRLPDASVEGVVFRRSAERLFGRFLLASEWKRAVAALPPATLAPGNGSHLDEGLKLAQRVLAESSGPARVIALTDGQLRQAFAPVPAAPATSAPDAAVHLVWVPAPPASPPAALAASPVQGACGLRLGAQAPELEPLVRPVALEHLHVEDARGERLLALPALEEERGLHRWLPSPHRAPGPWLLRGQRWGCAFSAPVVADPALSADLGRTAFAWPASSGEARPFEAPPPGAGESFARAGTWLSARQSFLAVPAGAGPSTARVRSTCGTVGGVSGGVVGGGIACAAGLPASGTALSTRQAALTELLAPLLDTCLGESTEARGLQLRVEATGDELVDVAVTGADTEAQAHCLREAAWALRLPPLFQGSGPTALTLTPRTGPASGGARPSARAWRSAGPTDQSTDPAPGRR